MNALFNHVLLAYDGSPDSQKALEIAEGITRQSDARLYLVFVEGHDPYNHPAPYDNEALNDPNQNFPNISQMNSYEDVERLADSVMEQAKSEVSKDIDVRFDVLTGPPERRIIQYSEENDIDLIVIGNRGLGGVKRFVMGSISHKVSNDAHCPVLVTK
ncbi:universal stress protein [Alkalibacillus salilacus]|uniref:Nucleotide-binding universal stress UspA family protein n=1 Tax=Alkalibacillus salilacus TaxID=284582 RepID=A0ABT9VGA1_9BACI|nr:universal stress protein [Alkalibacillus salilacus]MDQ0159998.1 nucleotide-binding universal stress UspA family protein [Alkalibacillus salilacus]